MTGFADTKTVGRLYVGIERSIVELVFGNLPKFPQGRPVSLNVQLRVTASSIVTEKKNRLVGFHRISLCLGDR
jgi:hypothetical protein